MIVSLSKVALTFTSIDKRKVFVHHYRIDQQFSNSFEKWKTMGKPQQPSIEQYKELESAGQLQLLAVPEWKTIENGKAVLKFDLPQQAVSLIKLTW